MEVFGVDKDEGMLRVVGSERDNIGMSERIRLKFGEQLSIEIGSISGEVGDLVCVVLGVSLDFQMFFGDETGGV